MHSSKLYQNVESSLIISTKVDWVDWIVQLFLLVELINAEDYLI